jgi:hypothetical protein
MKADMQSRTKVSVSSFTPARSARLDRKCSCGSSSSASGVCDECQKRRLQRKPNSAGQTPAIPSLVHEVLASPGQALHGETREFMESRFGHDFSQVRIHTDNRAAESARQVDALAYTTGLNVVFGAGQFSPNTMTGRRLLAHELTHVVQQGSMSLAPTEIGALGDPAEQEAEAFAREIGDVEARRVGETLPTPREFSGHSSVRRQPSNQLGKGIKQFEIGFPPGEVAISTEGMARLKEVQKAISSGGKLFSVVGGSAKVGGLAIDNMVARNPAGLAQKVMDAVQEADERAKNVCAVLGCGGLVQVQPTAADSANSVNAPLTLLETDYIKQQAVPRMPILDRNVVRVTVVTL